MFNKGIPKVTICCLLFIQIQASGYTVGPFQDQTSSRTNTLFDDADDIQRQLDNEARDRIKFGRPKTIWVFHFPTHLPVNNSIEDPTENQLERCPRDLIFRRMAAEAEDITVTGEMTTPLPPSRNWDYSNQTAWVKMFPDCGGKSQSPVDLPMTGLIKARGARKLLFQNYNVQPKRLTLTNDGKRVILYGEWKSSQRPLIYGGAAHGRRYLFHSLTLHLPSEHTIGGLQYPLESQGLYISAEYRTMDEALDASPSDPQAFLAVANLYKFANHTHKGIATILNTAKEMGFRNGTITPQPISNFNPPFKEYACYQGSMTAPPCTESVLWLIRGRTLSIKRSCVEAAQEWLSSDFPETKHQYFRPAQPMNDRKVFLFK